MSVTSGPSARALEIISSATKFILGRPALEPVRLRGVENIGSPIEYQLRLKTSARKSSSTLRAAIRIEPCASAACTREPGAWPAKGEIVWALMEPGAWSMRQLA